LFCLSFVVCGFLLLFLVYSFLFLVTSVQSAGGLRTLCGLGNKEP
jgi:hypothetical protein